MVELYLIRLIRHGESCLLEKYNFGWFNPFIVVERKCKSIQQLIENNTPTILNKEQVYITYINYTQSYIKLKKKIILSSLPPS